MNILKQGFELMAFKDWMENKDLSDCTIDTYMKIIKSFLKFKPRINNTSEVDDGYKLDINDVNCYRDFLIDKHKKRVIKYQTQDGIKREVIRLGSIYNYKYALKQYIEYSIHDSALKNEILNALKDINIKLANSSRYEDKKELSHNELTQVLDSLEDEKHKVMMNIQALTGMRTNDILEIKDGSIQPMIELDVNVIKIQTTVKGGSKGVFYIWNKKIGEQLLDYILHNINKSGYYFLDRKQKIKIDNLYTLKVANYKRYWRDVKTALNTCHIDTTRYAPHRLRERYAKTVWDKYKDIDMVQRHLNHADSTTTMRYLTNSGIKIMQSTKDLQEE